VNRRGAAFCCLCKVMQFLSFVAWEPRDKARALPQLDGLPVGELGGLADRLPIVNALVGGAAT
jgi:hypothetical protein